MRTRAYVRHQERRAKARALRIAHIWGRTGDTAEWLAMRLYRNRRKCSCFMCKRGEPAKYETLTTNWWYDAEEGVMRQASATVTR